ncbi:M3 family metallopeptidase [Sphingomonas sp. RB1R13]|uniref:M3 family metallopeptidase n=1 Tax=Sphingomonas sp. RB1R13 TaxID=3096159 RepID=UPI002FCCAF15
MSTSPDAIRHLLGPWPGPIGGLPPLDQVTPELIEKAVMTAIEEKRCAISAICSSFDAATFGNTVQALEESGRSLRNAEAIRSLMTNTAALGEMPAVGRRLSSLVAELADEIALNDVLFARIEAVSAGGERLDENQARLVEVTRDRLRRQGAGLAPDRRARLIEINQLIADKQSQFHERELGEGQRMLWVSDAEELNGLPTETVECAAQLAQANDRGGEWAFANRRAVVWTVLQSSRHRGLRERMRDMWAARNAHGDQLDNRVLVAEVVTLRGEKARLLGFQSFAHLVTSARMAQTPERALAQLKAIWGPAHRDALARLTEMQELAKEDGLIEAIGPHDYLYYAERLRERRFHFDSRAVREYLKADNVIAALFDVANRLHGLLFRKLDTVPVLDPEVRVYEVSRSGELVGVLYLDLFARPGKMPSAWQQELRQAEGLEERLPPLSVICANIEQPGDDGPALMGWEIANVLFHEFGHALHMLLSRAPYPSLGSIHVEWDFVELPSQLNERWLYDAELLRRHARHYRTGDPMPVALIDSLIAVRDDERVTSVTLPYLAPAIVDLQVYLAASGEPVDALSIEQQVYARLQMPQAIDPVFKLPAQHHSFTDAYAAGLYSYLWADVMVAEVLEAFDTAEEGIYDRAVAMRWHDELLSVGSMRPAAEAFRNFRGRDPDPAALVRRFGLHPA